MRLNWKAVNQRTGQLPDNTIPMRALLAGARRKKDDLLALARKLVLAESPSDKKFAVDACVEIASEETRNRGGRIRIHRQRDFGAILEARFGPRQSKAAKPVMILGHLDTVWPIGTLRTMPCRIADGRLWGPGTLDMKVGVAMALTAIEMLTEAELLNRETVFLLNSAKRLGARLRGRLRRSLPRNVRRYSYLNRRRVWRIRLRARARGTGASTFTARPLMLVLISKREPAHCASCLV